MIKIDWEKVSGLLPVVVQEYDTGEVLMLAYMNEEALNLSLQTGYAHYFSRTKNRIWKKGEESGNVQKIEQISLDCDNDTLLLKVVQVGGVACHTGAKSCFFNHINSEQISHPQTQQSSKKTTYNVLDELYHVILDRKLNADPANSYVASMFHKGENSILKKVAEEAGEFVMACKEASFLKQLGSLEPEQASQIVSNLRLKTQRNEVVYEAADVMFHVLVALVSHSIHPDQVLWELARRFDISGIQEKNSRDDK